MGEKEGFLPFPKGFSTIAIHHNQHAEQWDSMAVVTPLVTSSTYKQLAPGEYKKFEYSRTDNPTREVLQNVLAALENGKYGLCLSSGLGAVSILASMFKSGDHMLVGNSLYGGTDQLFHQIFTKFGITFDVVDITKTADFEKRIKPNTKLIYLESPSNPLLIVADIKAVAAIAKKHNILLAVDNTFLTPFLQRPLDLGADIVLLSLSKYMNGHSDVVMGAIITKDEKLHNDLKFLQNGMGVIPSPFDCYQVIRSLKTLEVRMKQHVASSLVIGRFLEQHPKVERVIHPGLPSHPQHELVKRQTSGHNGMISFYIKGNLESSVKFLGALKVFTLAASLGGAESLVGLPLKMIPAQTGENNPALLNITDNLIRMSVGLEDVNDLVDDLKNALQSI